MSFGNVTVFTFGNGQMQADFDSRDIDLTLSTIAASVDADAPLVENIDRAKLLIDGLVVRPLIESFTNESVRDGLTNAYGYATTEYIEVLSAQLNRGREPSIAAEMARVTDLANNQVIAQTASLAIMDELAGRRGLLDDVDDGVYEEIRVAIATIIADTSNTIRAKLNK
jgi:hypothetical protein